MQQSSDQSFFNLERGQQDEQHTFWIKTDSPHLKKMVLSTIRLFEGTLFIKSNKKEFWKSRFFVLYSDRLNMHKNGRERKEVAIMLLGHVYLDLKCQSDSDKFPITMHSEGKKFVLHARSQDSRLKWLKYIRQTCILNTYRETYTNLKVLGKGTFAKVLLANRNHDKKQFAVKTFQKSSLLEKQSNHRIQLLNEIHLLRICDHPNIIKLYEIYESTEYIYLVMELLEGGELFETILKTGCFQEKSVAKLMFKIFDALQYLHEKQIMHRDLKPENIILKDNSDDFDIKLADFGLAATISSELSIRRCGTPGYVAPEILDDQKYDEKVDIFSAGVIFYILLSGCSPFYGSTQDEILEKNRLCEISYDFHKMGVTISDDALDLLQKLLNFNPKQRLSAAEALSHRFISQYYSARCFMTNEDVGIEEQIDDMPNDNYSAFENMKKFHQERSQQIKLKAFKLVQQTPMMGQRNIQQHVNNDSWQYDKSPQVQDSLKLVYSPSQFKKQSQDDSDSSINTPSTPLSTKETHNRSNFQGSTQLIQTQIKQAQQNTKRASQVRDQLKKWDL